MKNSKNLRLLKNAPLSSVARLLCLGTLSACSVGMSLNGKKDPDLSIVKQNTPRTDIEMQLGSPVKVETRPNGQILATYEYEIGKEASPGRAVAHGVMDVLTLGIWEVVGTPVEACKGDKMELIAIYDQKGHLVSASQKVAT